MSNAMNARAERPSRRASALLVLGAALGVVLAAAGLAAPRGGSKALASDLVARVNGEPIRREDYARLLEALASDRREPLDDAARQHVLDRLIEEELLVQHGLALGLARHDRRVRADLTASVIASVVADYDDLQPSEAEALAFYDQHRDFFTRPGRLRLRQIFCRAATTGDAAAAEQRATTVVARLRAGEAFATVAAELGDAPLTPLPDALLPAAKLRDYLGPTVLRAALELDVGAVSEAVRSSSGYHVVQVVERQADSAPPLSEILSEVQAELRRRAGEDALRAYLDDLRARADVVVAQPLP